MGSKSISGKVWRIVQCEIPSNHVWRLMLPGFVVNLRALIRGGPSDHVDLIRPRILELGLGIIHVCFKRRRAGDGGVFFITKPSMLIIYQLP